MDGRVGDRFELPLEYKGKFANAVGVPLDTPRGKAYPIPPGDGPVNLTMIERPDFCRENKNGPVHKK
ncbi:unnamed protein product [Caenorhabditis nigoni]